jgi:twitching motility two-component system response regulator PilG
MSSSSSTDPSHPLPHGAPDLSSHRLSAPTTRLGRGPQADRSPLIMVIDDSPAIRTILELSFARVGMRVESFADGLEAIAALVARQVTVPDLVLLDIDLPRLDGYAVAGVLRTNAAFADTPILMLSGRDGLVDRVRSRMVGAAGFIAKPFRPGDLIATVREHLGIAPPAPPSRPRDGRT